MSGTTAQLNSLSRVSLITKDITGEGGMRPPDRTAGKMDEALVHEPSAWSEAGTISLRWELLFWGCWFKASEILQCSKKMVFFFFSYGLLNVSAFSCPGPHRCFCELP